MLPLTVEATTGPPLERATIDPLTVCASTTLVAPSTPELVEAHPVTDGELLVRVAQRDRMHDCFELMEAVRARPQNVEQEVDFAGGLPFERHEDHVLCRHRALADDDGPGNGDYLVFLQVAGLGR